MGYHYLDQISSNQMSLEDQSCHQRSTCLSHEELLNDGDEEDSLRLLLVTQGARSCWESGKPKVLRLIPLSLDILHKYTWSPETLPQYGLCDL